MRRIDCTQFLICSYNIVAGILNVVWFPGEVASPLIIVGGSSAIFFLFVAKSYEVSLLSFFFNNVIVFYVLQMPDPCSFLVGLFLIMLASFFGYDVFLNLIFIAVLLSRIFYHQKMGEWGFGLVTELMFLRLYFIFFELFLQKEDRSEEGSRIEPFFYLIPLFGIAFLNLLYLDYGLKDMLIHINFLFASFFFLKAQRRKKPLSEILVANKREGIQTLLVVYFLILGVLMTQLNPGSAALSLYSNWLVGLGIQIGFLTALNYFFQN